MEPVAHYSCSTKIELSAALDVMQILPDLYVFRLQQLVLATNHSGSFTMQECAPEVSNIQGFVDQANLDRLRAGESFGQTQHAIFDPTMIADMRLFGYTRCFDRREHGYEEIWNVFDHLEKHPEAVEHIVIDGRNDHSLRDRFGVRLPLAVRFSYIDGRIANDTYDLRRAADHLETIENVLIEHEHGKIISRIPSYNAERGRDQTINFLWRPSREEYLRVYEVVDRKYKPKQCRLGPHEVIFDLDLLGLRACGAALFDSYYKSKERSRDYDV